MKCSRCGRDNPPEDKYCGECGIGLVSENTVTLKDLIDAGFLQPGAPFYAKRGKKDVVAILREDGTLEYEGKVYPTPLTALEAARGITCDGAYCWRLGTYGSGQITPLFIVRHVYQKQKGLPAELPEWW